MLFKRGGWHPDFGSEGPSKLATVSLAGPNFHRYLVEDATAYLRDEGGRMASLQLRRSAFYGRRRANLKEFDYIPSVAGLFSHQKVHANNVTRELKFTRETPHEFNPKSS
jgi:hypothetical protein